ncbi:hypothetical protein [Actinoplanes philippinensis]|uniref:hypothetical protein n=1 Tax=Actinoplanes philippinensis TaxID=35752 RepID=UPI0033EE3D69
MPWKEQPADLESAPARYPSHDYTGQGEIVTIRVGSEVVGFLSRKLLDWEHIGFLPRPDLSTEADTVRLIVYGILRDYAKEGRPMVDAWAAILDRTQHDRPKEAPLDGLRGD